MRILVVEDEKNLNQLLCERLRKENYSVDTCFDGEDALHYIATTSYDVILLDIMLPKVDGLTVLQTVRRQKNFVPILLLTARDAIEDRVKGLDHGADDYLIKPFSFDELLARLRVLLRAPLTNKAMLLQVGDLSMDLAAKTVTRGGKLIHLSSKEYALLHYMMLHSGIVLTRETLEQHIWNYDYQGASNVIDVYIRYLRKKIDADFEEKLIHTVRGHGYVLKVDV